MMAGASLSLVALLWMFIILLFHVFWAFFYLELSINTLLLLLLCYCVQIITGHIIMYYCLIRMRYCLFGNGRQPHMASSSEVLE